MPSNVPSDVPSDEPSDGHSDTFIGSVQPAKQVSFVNATYPVMCDVPSDVPRS